MSSLSKRYGDAPPVLDRLDLTIGDGELLVLVGPSGCGKSTTMRLVAGLERPTSGTISFGAHDVTALTPQERDVAMVFQSYALYPHKTVRDNLAFGLRVRGVARAEIDRRVGEAARVLELEALLGRRPRQLSGGQRQRVALGRAIVRSPQLFLLDEPLSNLDAQLRVQTRTELARLQRRLAATMLYVTHDQEEALTLGDRVAVMRAGRLEQVAPPLDVYRKPATAFVAGFVGSPAMNLVSARRDGASRIAGAGFALSMAAPDRPLLLGVRPQDVAIVAPERGDGRGRVDVIEALGRELLCHVQLEGGPIVRVLTAADARLAENDLVGLAFAREHLHLFDAEGGRRLELTV
jgi:ABC-type sugar transport system ATPase subunit